MVLLNKSHVKLLLVFTAVWFKIEILALKCGKHLREKKKNLECPDAIITLSDLGREMT